MERLAILPIENLTGNPDLDWVSRAAAGVLSTELGGNEHIQPLEVRSEADGSTAKATAALNGYIEIYKGELRCKAAIRDLATSRTIQLIDAAGPASSGVLPILNAVARRITPSPQAYSTSSEAALREYSLAATARDAEQLSTHLNQAIAADPHFAPPYFAQIEQLAARGDVAGAKAAADRANEAAGQFTPLDRARLHVLQANLNNDVPARTAAMADLARLQKGDVDVRKRLAELYLTQRKYKEAAQALEEASKITPADAAVWNSLGYAYGYAGDLNNALRSFEQYKQLAPKDANAFDSVGEVLFYSGNFAEAGKNFLTAHEKDTNRFAGGELYRAALCSLLTGDAAKADELFAKYADFRKADPAIAIQSAVWQYESGRQPAAIAAMEKAATGAASKDVASLAHMQLAIWYLNGGDREKARSESTAAMQNATSAVARNLAIASAFYSMPSASAAEWRARAERIAPNPAQNRAKVQLQAASLLFDRRAADAIPLWRELYESSGSTGSPEIPVFLAASYLETGKTDEAAKLIRGGIIPPRTPDPGTSSVAVAKFVVLRKQFGK